LAKVVNTQVSSDEPKTPWQWRGNTGDFNLDGKPDLAVANQG